MHDFGALTSFKNKRYLIEEYQGKTKDGGFTYTIEDTEEKFKRHKMYMNFIIKIHNKVQVKA